MRTWILATFVIAGLAGCGKKDKDDDKKAPAPAPDPTLAPQTANPAKDPVAPPAKPPEPPKAAFVDPASIPADKVFTVEELNATLAAFKPDTEVTVTGYATFFIGEEDTLRMAVTLVGEPGQKQDNKKDTRCDVVDADKDKKVDNKTLLTFRGKVGGRYGMDATSPLWLKECTLVSQGKGTADVHIFTAAYNGWFGGRELQVAGYYFGQTVSKKLPKDGGAIIDVRVDLLRKGGDFDMKVGCHLPLVEPAKELVATMEKHREALTVKGKLDEFAFGEPQLEPCTIVSQ